MPNRFTVVITTIQEPTACVRTLAQRLAELGAPLVVIGDKKGPSQFVQPNTELFTLSAQMEMPYQLAKLLPTGHYARKNLGYLIAMSRGAPCIYETDDDNAPNNSWRVRELATEAQRVAPRRWANVYRMFTDQVIWPRGFPLEFVNDAGTWAHNPAAPVERVDAPIQQGLADLSPDVDAVWRLIMDREFKFREGRSVWLSPNCWCPFNSQTTWWWPVAYPLMYLPSFCTFRMTDIWRSFVAQRCLWALGYGMVFHAAEAVQERNFHDLLRDFESEVPGYLNNQQIVQTLASVDLKSGSREVADNVVRCYEALIAKTFLPCDELPLLRAWLADVDGAMSTSAGGVPS